MKHGLLRSLLGKHICATRCVGYCHVDKVIVIEGQKAIATAVIKTLDGKTLHWILEVSWITDIHGVHSIINYEILKEDELDGYTPQNEALQSNRKRLFA